MNAVIQNNYSFSARKSPEKVKSLSKTEKQQANKKGKLDNNEKENENEVEIQKSPKPNSENSAKGGDQKKKQSETASSDKILNKNEPTTTKVKGRVKMQVTRKTKVLFRFSKYFWDKKRTRNSFLRFTLVNMYM